MIGVALLLILLIGGTILLGDRVGVQIARAAPSETAHSTSPITIRFSEAINHDSAAQHFHLDPAVPGSFSWSGAAMTFTPSAAMTPGSQYTVTVAAGALSADGRKLLNDYHYSFNIRLPRVAYLYPADASAPNVWIVDPANPDHPQQITHSPSGIYDFGVSPDGTQIAFAENNATTQTDDIKLIDLDTGALQQLTNCQSAACTTPVWRPDGKMIAYERVDHDPQFGDGPPRIWLIDLTSTPATTRPLFKETQILGYDAQWSADGNRIALVDRSSSSILIYDFTTDKIVSIASTAGTSGALSPDGKTLIYPDLVSDPTGSGGLVTKLRVAQIDTGDFSMLTDAANSDNDQQAEWRPDGRQIAISRQAGISDSAQIMIYDRASGQTTPVTTDPRYSNLFFRWDPTGQQIVIQRFPELDANSNPNPNGRPEIWTYDAATQTGHKLVINGFLPRWIP